MKIKVCGMKYPENIKEVSQLPIDMMGFIFYEKSPRYISDTEVTNISFGRNTKLVGVFVNETIDNILQKVSLYKLDIVQLHGNESPEDCRRLKKEGIKVIKAFPIEKPEDIRSVELYEKSCDYFLFDTKSPQYGGIGKKFDWRILSLYKGKTFFFLSGGIHPEDSVIIKKIDHPLLAGIDLNSRFEISPGLKDFEQLKKFILNFTS